MKLSKILFLVLLAVGFIIAIYTAYNTYDQIHRSETNMLEIYSVRIENKINIQTQNSDILEVLSTIDNIDTDSEKFSLIAEAMYNDELTHTIALEPDGIITQIYPLEGNEINLNKNVFIDNLTSIDSKIAKEQTSTIISGPFTLFQGETGLIIRNPIYNDSTFWGFSTFVMRLENLLDSAGIYTLQNLGYEYNLTTNYEGNSKIASQSENFNPNYALFEEINLSGNVWELGLYNKDKIYYTLVTGTFWFFIILVINIVIWRILKESEKARAKLKNRLETDALTKAYNRVKLESNLKDLQNSIFALFFIDLNKFKPVNDTYGHEMGDKLLIAYVRRLQSSFKINKTIYRLGGDEFVITIPDISSDKNATVLKNRIVELSSQPFSIDGVELNISASVGYALSNEAEDSETLLKIADSNMYDEKSLNSERDQR